MIDCPLFPDRMFGGYDEITPEILATLGVRALICDIDNTLVTYDDAEPTEALLRWFDRLASRGVKVAFVSNNDEARVAGFNRRLGYPAHAKAGKPKPHMLRVAIEELGVKPSECAMLGDQLFTDLVAGRLAGLTCLLVPPIRDKKTPLFRFKRALEAPILALWRRREAKRAKKQSNKQKT